MKLMQRSWFLPTFCVALLVVHWLNQLHSTYGLMFDEAQYWFWGKHLAFGYYSKPPVIAWLMGLSTALIGDTTFGVKMLGPPLVLATGLVLHAIARRLGHPKETAAWVLVIYLTLPIALIHSAFFSTDVPLQLCWALAMYATIVAIREPGKQSYWLLAGIAAGLGLLSKYTVVAFAASSLLALASDARTRPQLRTIWPWLASLLALLIFAPNLVWNAQNHFVTFTHTDNNVFSKQTELYPDDMIEFLFGQIILFGPILLMALLLSLRDIKRNGLLHSYVWPLAAAGVIVSLLAGAQAHWIAPCYLAATLIVVPELKARAPHWLKAALLFNLAMLVLFYSAPTLLPHLPLKRDPLARLFVWNDLASDVRPLVAQYPHAVLISDERKIAAGVTYGLRDIRGYDVPVYKWNPSGKIGDHYDLLTARTNLRGKDLLLLTRSVAPARIARQKQARLVWQETRGGQHFSAYLIPNFHGY